MHAKLDKLLVIDLRTAEENLSLAMRCIEANDTTEANNCFRSAELHAIRAFTAVSGFEMKLITIKIRVLAQIHLSGYFTDNCNTVKLSTVCCDIIQKLITSVEVQTALREEMYGRSLFRMILTGTGNKAKRVAILSEVADFCHSVTVVTGQQYDIREANSVTAVTLFKTRPLPLYSLTYALTVANGMLFAGSSDSTIKVWDLSTTTELFALSGHTSFLWCLAVHETKLYSGSAENSIKVWDLTTRAELTTLVGHTGVVTALAIAGGRLFSGSWDDTIKVWDLRTLKEVATLEDHLPVRCLAVDSVRLYSGSGDSTIRVWDLITLARVAILEGHNGDVCSFAIVEGRLFSGSHDNSVKVWDLSTLTEVATLTGHADSVTALALSVADGKLYSGSKDKTVKVWDLSTLTEIATLTHCTGIVKSLTVVDGKLYTSAMSGPVMESCLVGTLDKDNVVLTL